MLDHKRLLPFAIAATMAASPAFAQDLQLTIVNESGHAILEVSAAPAATEQWERLGVETLENGYAGNIVIAGGAAQCDYDLRMVFDDGELLEDAVNICDMGTYTIN